MKKEELAEKLHKYNDDELFYQRYYNAHSQKWMLEEFLKSQDSKEVLRRRLFIPEISNVQIPSDLSEEEYFQENTTNSIFISKHNRFTPPFFHWHLFYELVYVLEGTCTHALSNETLTMNAGDFCLLAPHTSHAISVFDSSVVINILIRRNTFDDIFFNLIRDHNIISLFFNQTLYEHQYHDYLLFSTAGDAFLQDHILSMFLEHQNQQHYADTILNSMLMILFSRILRDYEDTAVMSKSSFYQRDTVLPMLSYIQDHFQSITLQALAEEFHFSVPYCSRLIKQSTGKSFSKILQQIRFSRAKTLLTDTNHSISDISYQTGFPNTEHFSRTFKTLFQMTPGEYRKHASEQQWRTL